MRFRIRPSNSCRSFARNITGLLAIQPGVSLAGVTSDSRSGAVNGGKPDQANVTLDGVDVNNQNNRAAFTSVLRVTLDSVEEFRTDHHRRERGHGPQLWRADLSGYPEWTNELHGAAYEYHRNTVTAANDWFNNRTGVARPALLINVFGMRLGGPIIKNRTFRVHQLRRPSGPQRGQRSSHGADRRVPRGQSYLRFDHRDQGAFADRR
jgi:hypothetical protein